MSFILDALRRADAERARGRVPGLDAQPLGEADGARRDRSAALGWAAAGAGGAVVVAVGAWLLWPSNEVPVTAPPAPPIATPKADAAPATRVEGSEARAGAVAPPVPRAADTPPRLAAEERPTAPPAEERTTAPPPERAAVPRVAAAPPAPTAAARRSTAEPAPAPLPPTPSPVVALADLPPGERSAFPALRLGGAIGSPDPKSRLLIVDGVLLRQGDEAAPGLVLREIRLRSAVVEWRGRRVEVPF